MNQQKLKQIYDEQIAKAKQCSARRDIYKKMSDNWMVWWRRSGAHLAIATRICDELYGTGKSDQFLKRFA